MVFIALDSRQPRESSSRRSSGSSSSRHQRESSHGSSSRSSKDSRRHHDSPRRSSPALDLRKPRSSSVDQHELRQKEKRREEGYTSSGRYVRNRSRTPSPAKSHDATFGSERSFYDNQLGHFEDELYPGMTGSQDAKFATSTPKRDGEKSSRRLNFSNISKTFKDQSDDEVNEEESSVLATLRMLNKEQSRQRRSSSKDSSQQSKKSRMMKESQRESELARLLKRMSKEEVMDWKLRVLRGEADGSFPIPESKPKKVVRQESESEEDLGDSLDELIRKCDSLADVAAKSFNASKDEQGKKRVRRALESIPEEENRDEIEFQREEPVNEDGKPALLESEKGKEEKVETSTEVKPAAATAESVETPSGEGKKEEVKKVEYEILMDSDVIEMGNFKEDSPPEVEKKNYAWGFGKEQDKFKVTLGQTTLFKVSIIISFLIFLFKCCH